VASPNSPQNSKRDPQRENDYFVSGPAIKFLALGVLILIGIGIYSFPKMTASRWTNPLKKPDFTFTSRKTLPQFEWSSGDKTFKTGDLKGKWHLLSFWAYWCQPCQTELPELADLDLNWNGPDLDVVTVNLDDPKDENFELAKKFIAENQITLPVYFDSAGDLKKKFAVSDLPRHMLINPEGEIVWDKVGAYNWANPSVRSALIRVLEPAQAQDAAGSEESPPQD
jgi:thiol-disulfide isomerase/thioredoxin